MAQATQHCAARGRNATAFQSSDSSFFGPPPFGVNRAAMLQENASAACSLPGIPARGPWMADLGSLASGPRSDVGSLAGGPIGPRLAINNYCWGQNALVFIGMSVEVFEALAAILPHKCAAELVLMMVASKCGNDDKLWACAAALGLPARPSWRHLEGLRDIYKLRAAQLFPQNICEPKNPGRRAKEGGFGDFARKPFEGNDAFAPRPVAPHYLAFGSLGTIEETENRPPGSESPASGQSSANVVLPGMLSHYLRFGGSLGAIEETENPPGSRTLLSGRN